MMRRIAFMGPMRSGKDASAEIAIRLYGGEIIKFAQPLYDMQKYIYERSYLTCPDKDRLLLQWLGTEWGRSKDPYVWVNIFLKDLENKQGHLYVTDCRFKNEARILREHGFKLYRIDRPLEERIKAGASLMTHASEKDLEDFDEYDEVIDNSKTLEDLEQLLKAALSQKTA